MVDRLNSAGEPPASGEEFPSPASSAEPKCRAGRAEMQSKLGHFAEQAEALLWAEPKCTVHFLNFL
jgi:hypothetical protein